MTRAELKQALVDAAVGVAVLVVAVVLVAHLVVWVARLFGRA